MDEHVGSGGLSRHVATGQSENQIGKVVKMSRKSTIDQNDNTSKMVVVLEKNRAGSQKKQEFAQSFTPNSNPNVANSVSPTT